MIKSCNSIAMQVCVSHLLCILLYSNWFLGVVCVANQNSNANFSYDSEIEKTTVFITQYEKDVQQLLQSPDEIYTFRQNISYKYPYIYIVLFMSVEFNDINLKGMYDIVSVQSHLQQTIVKLGLREKQFGNPNGAVSSNINGQRVELSKLFVRYLYDLYSVESAFLCNSSLCLQRTNILTGARVLEIGGGYGAFGAIFAEAHALASYTIVDLESVLPLQQRFIEHIYSSESRITDFHFIAPGNTDPISSDLLYSFLCIDAIPENVMAQYVSLYIAHAHRGYLVLCSNPLVVQMLFERIVAVQPTAYILFMDDLYGTMCDPSHFPLRVIWEANDNYILGE